MGEAAVLSSFFADGLHCHDETGRFLMGTRPAIPAHRPRAGRPFTTSAGRRGTHCPEAFRGLRSHPPRDLTGVSPGNRTAVVRKLTFKVNPDGS